MIIKLKFNDVFCRFSSPSFRGARAEDGAYQPRLLIPVSREAGQRVLRGWQAAPNVLLRQQIYKAQPQQYLATHLAIEAGKFRASAAEPVDAVRRPKA